MTRNSVPAATSRLRVDLVRASAAVRTLALGLNDLVFLSADARVTQLERRADRIDDAAQQASTLADDLRDTNLDQALAIVHRIGVDVVRSRDEGIQLARGLAETFDAVRTADRRQNVAFHWGRKRDVHRFLVRFRVHSRVDAVVRDLERSHDDLYTLLAALDNATIHAAPDESVDKAMRHETAAIWARRLRPVIRWVSVLLPAEARTERVDEWVAELWDEFIPTCQDQKGVGRIRSLASIGHFVLSLPRACLLLRWRRRTGRTAKV